MLEHMGGKFLSYVRPVDNGSFEAECVALLAVSVFALGCSWCAVEVVDEGTSGMNILSWWDGVVDVSIDD